MIRTPKHLLRHAALTATFAIAGGGALAISGLSSAADAHGPPTSIRATVSAATRTVQLDGYSVVTKCTGHATGSTPTIVFLAGEDDALTRFSSMQSTLSSLTRVCSYDRLGEGTSSRPRTDQTIIDSAAILHGLLAKLHVASRGVVLVGHSLGGLIAARYASLYHSQVKAVVLLDASPPSVEAGIKHLIPAGTRGLAGVVREEVTGLASGHNAERLVFTDKPLPSIGSIPITVAQHGEQIYATVPKYGEAIQKIWSEGQQKWLALSSDSRMVVAKKSGHYIYLDQPELTFNLIKQALTKGEVG
jgi:pimeloyl-ACP methyl ester carboxylesterase